jgi:hypothetical protein
MNSGWQSSWFLMVYEAFFMMENLFICCTYHSNITLPGGIAMQCGFLGNESCSLCCSTFSLAERA